MGEQNATIDCEPSRTHKGVYYWHARFKAQAWAEAHGWPTDRVIIYGLGFAVQAGKSGNYAGPDIEPRQWPSNVHPVIQGAEKGGSK